MKDLVALLFKTTNRASGLNIGDTVSVRYDNLIGSYVIEDGNVIYGMQSLGITEEADSLLSYVSDSQKKKTGVKDLVLWNDIYDEWLDSAVVEVVAITNNYIVVLPNRYVQTMLSEKIEEQELCVDDIDQYLKDLFSYDSCAGECEECSAQEPREEVCEKDEKEETKVFSDLGSSFGKINSSQFKLSINGLAVRGKDGKFVTFNPETRELVEVTTGFFDDMNDLLFLMPATELETGDIILHQNKPYYITKTNDSGVKGIDFEEAVENTIIPKTNVFGMKYYTKVFNCLGTNNILGSDMTSNPMMAYALMGGKDFDLSKMMMFQALSGQGNGIADFSENPIMLMALMSNEKGDGDLGNFAKMQILSQVTNGKKKEAKKATKEN